MNRKEHWHKNRDTLYKSQSLSGSLFVYLGVAVIHPEVVFLQYLGQLVAVRHGVVHSSGLGFLQLKEITKQYLLLHQFLLTPFDLTGYKGRRQLMTK